jgi:MOSC domain-containing protein YiiM
MSRVWKLYRAPKRGWPMEELFVAEAVSDVGLAGCAHARTGGSRQILLMDRETLDSLQLSPGIIRENITTEGLNVNGLKPGETLRVGEAVLQVTVLCTPCSLMDKIRSGLRREIRGRRGMMCKVLQGGLIRPGDAIQKVTAAVQLDERI